MGRMLTPQIIFDFTFGMQYGNQKDLILFLFINTSKLFDNDIKSYFYYTYIIFHLSETLMQIKQKCPENREKSIQSTKLSHFMA